MQQVIIDYGDLGDSELSKFAETVYLALNGNTNFTWPAERLTALQTKIADFNTKLLAARTNDSVKIAVKNESRGFLLKDLHDLAEDVNRQSAGNVAKLLSSGFILVRDRGMVGELDPPTGLKVVNGHNPGEILCNVDAHPDAVMYFFFFAPVPAPADIDEWKLRPTTKHKKTFRGFKSGQQYAVKCAYQGRVDELNYSETVYIYAQ